jgi:hypothetical protein
MEIHRPEKPIHSFRDFLLQILTITVGILIALSLEALLSAVHHRALVREAKANLAHELRANRRELDEAVLKAMPRLTKEQEDAVGLIEALLARRPPQTKEVRANYSIAQLTSTSWATAQSTGAVAYMEYDEVERFANVYELQERFASIQDRLVEGYVMSGPGTDPDKASPDELRRWKERIVTIQAHLRAAQGIGQALAQEYDKALAALGEH